MTNGESAIGAEVGVTWGTRGQSAPRFDLAAANRKRDRIALHLDAGA